MTKSEKTGLRRGLTHYGDPDFALYLRRSFARSMGYGEAMLERPVVGICNTASGFNNCHRLLPELIEAFSAARHRRCSSPWRVNLRDRRQVATSR